MPTSSQANHAYAAGRPSRRPSTARNNAIKQMVLKSWADFQNRWIRGESTSVDMVLTTIVSLFTVYYLIKFYNWASSVPEDKIEKWMERATACESKYSSIVIATFFTSCCFWLLYLLHLTERHCERVIDLIIEKLEAIGERNVALERCKLREEMIEELRKMNERAANELHRMREDKANREASVQ